MPKRTLNFPFSQTHVNLTDYDYERDLEIRRQMSSLSCLEVEFLQEIIHQSLHFSVSDLTKHLNISLQELNPLLERWSHIKLFKQQASTLIINKDVRKIIELELEKFDEDFKPDLAFLQNNLSLLPPNILLDWYAIPRTAHEFFPAIVNKFFITPQTYLNHLEQLHFKNSILFELMQEIAQTSQPYFYAKDLKKKYDLSSDVFDLFILILEHHFVCCLSYRQIDDYWERVITPLKEWQEVLKYKTKAQKSYIQHPVEKVSPSGLAYIDTLQETLKQFQIKKGKELDPLFEELVQLGFIEHNQITSQGKHWLNQSRTEQIDEISNYFLNESSYHKRFGKLWNIKQLHLVDRSLRLLEINRWVQFDLFLKSLTIPLGDRDPLSLKRKGIRWAYEFPVYTDLEKEFIRVAILERLSRFGVIEVGKFQENACFRLTPFGTQFIS